MDIINNEILFSFLVQLCNTSRYLQIYFSFHFQRLKNRKLLKTSTNNLRCPMSVAVLIYHRGFICIPFFAAKKTVSSFLSIQTFLIKKSFSQATFSNPTKQFFITFDEKNEKLKKCCQRLICLHKHWCTHGRVRRGYKTGKLLKTC